MIYDEGDASDAAYDGGSMRTRSEYTYLIPTASHAYTYTYLYDLYTPTHTYT